MYIEASDIRGANRKVGDTARLLSPDVSAPTGCLKFHYHMYGTSMGSLKILLQPEGDDAEPLWNRSGNQGNLWYEAQVSFQSAKPYKVRCSFWNYSISSDFLSPVENNGLGN